MPEIPGQDTLGGRSLRRRFHVILPPDWMEHTPLPIILCYHGNDWTLKGEYDTMQFDELLRPGFFEGTDYETDGNAPPKFVLVHMECAGLTATRDGADNGGWNSGSETLDGLVLEADDARFTRRVILGIARRLRRRLVEVYGVIDCGGAPCQAIDQRRIFLAGFSSGAKMVYRLAVELDDDVSPRAIFVVAGSIGGSGTRWTIDGSSTQWPMTSWEPERRFPGSAEDMRSERVLPCVLAVGCFADDTVPLFAEGWQEYTCVPASGSGAPCSCLPACTGETQFPMGATPDDLDFAEMLCPKKLCFDRDINPNGDFFTVGNGGPFALSPETIGFAYRLAYSVGEWALYYGASGRFNEIVRVQVDSYLLDGTSRTIRLPSGGVLATGEAPFYWQYNTTVDDGDTSPNVYRVQALIVPRPLMKNQHVWPTEPRVGFDGAVLAWQFFQDPHRWQPSRPLTTDTMPC